jgi:hypothetical protein
VENQLNFQQMSAIVILSEVLFTKCALNPDVRVEDAKEIFREQVSAYYTRGFMFSK